eukprot:gene11145-12983_t
MDIRTMVTDAIRRGVDIDRPVEGTNTLLHIAVQMNLCKSVGKLLSAGADPRKENENGDTAYSIALDNGNQMVLQALSLRDEYTVHLRLFNRAQDISNSRGSMASVASELCSIVSKMVPINMPVPFEDYMDWTDSQRCRNLQALMESSRVEEKTLRRSLDDLNEQRARNAANLVKLHNTLREREHGLCIRVWEAIQCERHSRRQFERATSQVASVKELLQNALKFVHYFGIVRVAPFKRIVLKSWHRSFVEITGSALVIGSYHEEQPAGGKSFSFSMSLKGKSAAKKRTSSMSTSTTTSPVPSTGAPLTHHHTTTHRNSSTTTPSNLLLHSESECEGDTDNSNTNNPHSTFATTEMLAAHALGTTGLPVSPSRNTPNTTNTTSTTNYHNTNTTYTHTTSPYNTRTSESDTVLAPLRRQFQKLHPDKSQIRSINIQDIVAVEVCKVDKSLGVGYIQIELKIHYLKEGHLLSQLLRSPIPVKPLYHNNPTHSTIHPPDNDYRERQHSNTSTASNNSGTSLRTTSTSSITNGVSALLSPFKSKINAKSTTTVTSAQKIRSVSTGGSSAPIFSPIPPIHTTPSGTAEKSKKTSKSSKKSLHNIPADKLEVVWLKLPMQSNTIQSRAVAKGRSDDSEGPILTFELFIAILRRINENVSVFSISNGVETSYRVNPPIGEEKVTVPTTPTARKLPRIDSFTSPTKKGPVQSSTLGVLSPNASMVRKALSSGDLVGLDTPSSETTGLTTIERSPKHAHNNNTAAKAAQDTTTEVNVTRTTGGLSKPLPLDLHLPNTLYNSNNISVSRSDSGSSLSPRRNTANTQSAHTPPGGYIGGSMNSTSGLTAIESLVGMAHRSHTLHNNNLSHNGGSHANSNTSSSNTSTSASMNSTSLSSSINTSSLSSGHLYSSHRSPRYNSNLQDILYEETSADIQAMLEEGDYSDHSSRQYQADDGDSSVHSTSSHAPRFLKLSRRYTEGDKALNSHDMSVNPSIQTTAPAPYIAATLFDERTSEQHVAHTLQRDISADENSIFRDIESDEEGEITTRHTFSNITTTTTTTTVTNTYTTSKKVTNTTDVPSTPPTKSVLIPHTYTTAGVENWELESSEPLSYSAPPMALKRVGSRTNNATTSVVESNAFASPTKKDKNSSMYSMNTNTAVTAIENQDELIQYPAKLSRMLDKARAKRTKIENRLVELLESREKLREIIQYLQSLRAIVDNPPATPTRSLAKTKAPSIDKAMQLLNVYTDHINHVTEGLNTHSISLTHTSEARGKLFDAEEFVRIMLNSSSNITTGSGNTTSCSITNTTGHTHSTNTQGTLQSGSFHYGSEYTNYNYTDTMRERESFTSTSSRGANPNARRVGNSVNSLGNNSVGYNNNQHSSHSPVHIRRLFTEDTYTSTHYASTTYNQHYSTNSGHSSNSNRDSFTQRPSLAASPVFPSEPTPQLLRSPPPGYMPEFISVMSQLERIWECELESFNAVEKLAQCLDQRGRTWQRLKHLQKQEQSMVVPTKHDLYDIEF